MTELFQVGVIYGPDDDGIVMTRRSSGSISIAAYGKPIQLMISLNQESQQCELWFYYPDMPYSDKGWSVISIAPYTSGKPCFHSGKQRRGMYKVMNAVFRAASNMPSEMAPLAKKMWRVYARNRHMLVMPY